MKKNLVLIGMMGSGKTTIGKEISKKSSLKFKDTDLLIENHEKMKIKDIIEHGLVPIYSTMKAYGMKRAKHPDGSRYFKLKEQENKNIVNVNESEESVYIEALKKLEETSGKIKKVKAEKNMFSTKIIFSASIFLLLVLVISIISLY